MQAMPAINPRIVSLNVIRASFQVEGSSASRNQKQDDSGNLSRFGSGGLDLTGRLGFDLSPDPRLPGA